MHRWRGKAACPPLLGLDLGDTSVRLVELGGTPQQPVLEHLAHETLDKGWMNDGQIEAFDAVAEAVRRAVQHSGTRTRRVALALPASSVVTQRLRLPAGLPERALELQVAAEAQQHLPFAADEACLDFCVLGPAAAAGEVEVLVAAARQDRVQDRQGLAEAAGLEAVVLDMASHAAHRALARIAAVWAAEDQAAVLQAAPGSSGQDGPGGAMPLALFEIGAFSTTLKLLRGEELLHERDLPVGGAQLTRLIARQCGLGFEEAERLKRAGTLPEAITPELQAGFVDGLAQELARALQIGFTSSPCHHVRGVVLAGATAALPGLQVRVGQLTGFETRLANPFEAMSFGPAVPAARALREAPGCLKACGLALRRFLP
ncbi:type IV pilus assembly protein PilM [Azohydromonas sp. G-1-1-14]|uniref:Type IV pilus assembly protein PilM n=1 Tax=Azohydromonas caseinilytica TaxID=2728836 RepID=A0A848F4D6_9BURK|nr:type IV pilus assembly protein PilM [Azohydromonas caseinilytica]